MQLYRNLSAVTGNDPFVQEAPTLYALRLSFQSALELVHLVGNTVKQSVNKHCTDDRFLRACTKALHVATEEERRAAIAHAPAHGDEERVFLFVFTVENVPGSTGTYVVRSKPTRADVSTNKAKLADAMMQLCTSTSAGVLDVFQALNARGDEQACCLRAKDCVLKLRAACIVCGAATKNACGGCNAVGYCGDACAAGDWKRHKRAECDAAKFFASEFTRWGVLHVK
jgi:hypothetical protein